METPQVSSRFIQNWLPYIPQDVIEKSLASYDIKSCAKILEDADLAKTIDAFFQHDLNVLATAQAMYMHRNTLNYRLNKIVKATGLDIRRFEDAIVFRVIMTIYFLKQKQIKD